MNSQREYNCLLPWTFLTNALIGGQGAPWSWKNFFFLKHTWSAFLINFLNFLTSWKFGKRYRKHRKIGSTEWQKKNIKDTQLATRAEHLVGVLRHRRKMHDIYYITKPRKWEISQWEMHIFKKLSIKLSHQYMKRKIKNFYSYTERYLSVR